MKPNSDIFHDAYLENRLYLGILCVPLVAIGIPFFIYSFVHFDIALVDTPISFENSLFLIISILFSKQ